MSDLLSGDFKQSQYGRVILPFALLRRLECVLESSKSAVLVEAAKMEKMAIAEEAEEKLLLRATAGLSFFNTSTMDLHPKAVSNYEMGLVYEELNPQAYDGGQVCQVCRVAGET